MQNQEIIKIIENLKAEEVMRKKKQPSSALHHCMLILKIKYQKKNKLLKNKRKN